MLVYGASSMKGCKSRVPAGVGSGKFSVSVA